MFEIIVVFVESRSREKLDNYFIIKAKKNPESLFVQKSNNHRGIKIQPLVDLDLETPGTFVQEYVRKPLLIGAANFFYVSDLILTFV